MDNGWIVVEFSLCGQSTIELAWSKIKAYLRKVKARAFDKLFSALGLALDTISHDDFSAWMKHCGYRLALVKLL